jgi:hypothetical protein
MAGTYATESNLLSPAQCRAARAMLDWPAAELAARARVPENWLEAFERGGAPGGDADPDEAARVRRALEAGGIDFLDSGFSSTGGGPGLRVRQASGGYIPSEQLSSANDV